MIRAVLSKQQFNSTVSCVYAHIGSTMPCVRVPTVGRQSTFEYISAVDVERGG
jgi:hypothetical protein